MATNRNALCWRGDLFGRVIPFVHGKAVWRNTEMTWGEWMTQDKLLCLQHIVLTLCQAKLATNMWQATSKVPHSIHCML